MGGWDRGGRLMRRIGIGMAIALASGLAFWFVHGFFAPQDKKSFLRWEETRTVAAGNVLYRAHCASCHGVPGSSQPVAHARWPEPAPAHDHTGHTWQHPDFALFQLIRDGVAVANCTPVDPERMPSFAGILSDSELVAVLSYIKSTWPEDIRAHHDKVNGMYAAYNRAVADLIEVDRPGG